MPTYQYECDACQHAFEVFQSMLEKKLKRCPQCKKNRLHRLIGAGSGIIFKGSGFYATDYKKKEAVKCPARNASEKASEGGAKSENCKTCPLANNDSKKETSQAI